MANNILNPLEKELLIKLYRRSHDVKISDFCEANNVSVPAFRSWLKRYDSDGIAGLYRSKKTPSILPAGIKENEENLRRELIRTRIELERLKKRLHPDPERRWDSGSIRALIREEYAIIEALSKEFPVKELCELCGVSRSGYYKWRGRVDKRPKQRAKILKLVQDCHDAHPSHGYRWIHAYLKSNKGITVSADYIRRCFRYLGISAKTRHCSKTRKKSKHKTYPNLIFSTWETIDRPRQVIVSDMTAFWTRDKYFELVLYFDVFTKQIIGHGITKRRGWSGVYYEGLAQAVDKIDEARLEAVEKLEVGSGDICVIHTDQGSVYTSRAYNEIIKEKGIVRSCSRPGKPTDNPVNESLNGWIKEELFCDFNLHSAQSWEVPALIEDYITWYNSKRPSYSLGYKTPDEFYDEFKVGQIEKKDTFENRVLDETPKFVREKLKRAEKDAERNTIGTSNTTLSPACVY